MKKIFKFLFIISSFVSLIIIILNIIVIVRIMFFGMTIIGGGEYPDSIWLYPRTIIGFNGLKEYYSNSINNIYIYILIFNLLFHVAYFKIIKRYF